RNHIVFQGIEFDQFSSRSGLSSEEAMKLVETYVAARGPGPLPTGSCVLVDGEYFFSIEERNKLGSLSLNGYYVDPVGRAVTLRRPNVTYYSEPKKLQKRKD
ncbi:MAG: hypothetical protein AAF514_15395, partial [Verrucomicrobiota bacterium]